MKGCWYDWKYFKRDGFKEPTSARIMMIIDLTDCVLRYDNDQESDTLASDTDLTRINHLTKEKWVIVP